MTKPEQPENTAQPKTLQDHLKDFLGALVIVGITVLSLEGIVRFTDPWGLIFFNDLLVMGNELFELDETRSYKMIDGHHTFSYWDMTMEDSIRVSPDVNTDADCTFIMLGDSVTMGHGVDDEEVWVNLLGAAFPDIHFVNTGVTTYNSTNVAGTKRAFPGGDAYIYLIIENDILATVNPNPEAFPGQEPSTAPYLVRYVSFILFGRHGSETQLVPPADDPRMQRFTRDIHDLMADGDTWLVSFEHIELADVIEEDMGYDVQTYPYPPHQISYVDNHFNPQGNIEFAELLAPFISELQAERCPEA